MASICDASLIYALNTIFTLKLNTGNILLRFGASFSTAQRIISAEKCEIRETKWRMKNMREIRIKNAPVDKGFYFPPFSYIFSYSAKSFLCIVRQTTNGITRNSQPPKRHREECPIRKNEKKCTQNSQKIQLGKILIWQLRKPTYFTCRIVAIIKRAICIRHSLFVEIAKIRFSPSQDCGSWEKLSAQNHVPKIKFSFVCELPFISSRAIHPLVARCLVSHRNRHPDDVEGSWPTPSELRIVLCAL